MTNIQNQVFERSFLSKLSKYNSEMVSPIISWAYCIVSYRMVQSVTNIFEYSNVFDPNIYLDIRSYHFLDTNIFGYSFVSTFWIQIYSDIRS